MSVQAYAHGKQIRSAARADGSRASVFLFPDNNLNERWREAFCRLGDGHRFRWVSASPTMICATSAEKALRILLVEDNEIIGNALRDHVVASGWTVDWISSLQPALLAIANTDYTLILLDLRLPDGNGLDLLKRMGTQTEIVPVIILSAYDQVSDRIEGLEMGAIDYLVKPFDLGEMMARIETLIESRNAAQAQPNRRTKLRVA